MRTQKAVVNSIFNISSQLVQLILSFIIRNLFIKYIGIEYLGLNGLFSNILSALNLADLGIGAAITYHLYSALASKDTRQINSLMRFYKKAYYTIGSAVLFLGFILMFFIQYFIKEQNADLSFLRIIFLIQLLGTASTYFLAYKRTSLFADQKNYIAALIDSTTQIVLMLVRVLTLIIFKDYIVYLVIILVQNISANVIISFVCNRIYPYLNQKTETIKIKRTEIVNNLKNISIEKIVTYIYYSTDNIIISKFLGLESVGLLSNYTLIVISIKSFFSQITSAVQASLGNLVHSEDNKEKTYDVLSKFTFFCYMCSSFCTVSLLVLTPSFITIWLGKHYVMPDLIIVLLSMAFFTSTLRMPLDQLSSVYGLFRQMKYISIAAAIVNLTISLILINKIGIAGTLLGTLICDFVYWAGQIYAVLYQKLQVKIKGYLFKIFAYSAATTVECILTLEMSKLIKLDTAASLFVKILLCLIVPNTINLILYKRSEEFSYFINLLSDTARRSIPGIRRIIRK